jgi:hypothetical protein
MKASILFNFYLFDNLNLPPVFARILYRRVYFLPEVFFAEQDKALDVIYSSVNRQKNIANVFSEEVDSQNQLLGSIEGKVDRNVLGSVTLECHLCSF